MVRILKFVLDAGVEYKTVPGLGHLIQGMELGKQIREVAVEDLLGEPRSTGPEQDLRAHPGQSRPGHWRCRLDRVGALPADRMFPSNGPDRLRCG